MAEIALSGIAHSYHRRPRGPEDFALKPMEHVWRDGGAYALLGPSGCGKTTLLNLISGLLTPTRGRILFDGHDVTPLSTERRNIAQVFQFPVIYDTMSVFENLAFPLRNRGWDRQAVEKRVRQVAAMLHLEDKLPRKARNLTADQKQIISLGRGIVRPDVAAILLDEPLTVIDPHMKWLLRSQLKHLHRELGLTTIYVTHDQTEALTFADTVMVMHEGEVVQVGTPSELFDQPRHTFVGYFIGSPGMNVLPAAVEGRQAWLGEQPLPLGRAYPLLPEGRVEIGIRPEHARLSRNGDGLPVTVRKVEDVGRHKIVRAELMGHEISVLAAEDLDIDGEQARVVFDSARVNVYADGHLVKGEAP